MTVTALWARLSRWWPHDDTPGYTDYPEVDIQTHRSNAKWLNRIGWFGLLLGVIGGYLYADPYYVVAGFIWLLLSQWARDGLRLQALEWEFQLYKEREGSDGE